MVRERHSALVGKVERDGIANLTQELNDDSRLKSRKVFSCLNRRSKYPSQALTAKLKLKRRKGKKNDGAKQGTRTLVYVSGKFRKPKGDIFTSALSSLKNQLGETRATIAPTSLLCFRSVREYFGLKLSHIERFGDFSLIHPILDKEPIEPELLRSNDDHVCLITILSVFRSERLSI